MCIYVGVKYWVEARKLARDPKEEKRDLKGGNGKIAELYDIKGGRVAEMILNIKPFVQV